MPTVRASEPRPSSACRILVAGATGSGKSTLAKQIAEVLRLPYVELDALHHGPKWMPRPSFLEDVRALAEGEQWTTEWQYPTARPVLAERAELMVFLDLPRWLVTYRVARRTLLRAIKRTELWNGCREAPLQTIFRNRDHILRWSVRTYPEHAPRVRELGEQRPDLPIVWLASRKQVRQWLDALSRPVA